jgi:hypothetical protein
MLRTICQIPPSAIHFLALGVLACPLQGFAEAGAAGHTSVAEAYADLSARPQAVIREEAGWIVITDNAIGPQTTWTFARKEHPAYPVMIRRDAVMKRGEPTIRTRFLCEGPGPACEALYTTLENAN